MVAAVAGRKLAGLRRGGSAQKARPAAWRGLAGCGPGAPRAPGQASGPSAQQPPRDPPQQPWKWGSSSLTQSLTLKGEESLEVKERERGSQQCIGQAPLGFICGGDCGRQRMAQPLEAKLSDHAPCGTQQVAGSELQFPARWSPGRFGAACVIPPRFGAVFGKPPTLVLS